MKRNLVTIVIVLLLLIGIGASYKPSETSQSSTQSLMSTSEIGQSNTQPVISTSATIPSSTVQYDAVITYSEKYVNSIGSLNPSKGDEYLILTLTIQDNNIANMSISPLYFHVIINNAKYDYDSTTYSLPDPLKSVELFPKGTTSGSITFEIPIGTTSYEPTYESWFASESSINWVHA
jgi:hypothetical protein